MTSPTCDKDVAASGACAGKQDHAPDWAAVVKILDRIERAANRLQARIVQTNVNMDRFVSDKDFGRDCDE